MSLNKYTISRASAASSSHDATESITALISDFSPEKSQEKKNVLATPLFDTSFLKANHDQYEDSEYSFLGSADGKNVFINTHAPFCVSIVGLQGAGKSHSASCILEGCMIPAPGGEGEEGVSKLHQPMTALVAHYADDGSVCEAIGLAKDGPNGHRAAEVVVLTTRASLKNKQKLYAEYECEVRPLLFDFGTLGMDNIKKLMNLRANDTQLYMATVRGILQNFQQDNKPITLNSLEMQLKGTDLTPQQRAPLNARLSLIRNFCVSENDKGSAVSFDDLCKPGKMIIVDLSDPLIESAWANSVFEVVLGLFNDAKSTSSCDKEGSCGKVAFFDEAHQYLSDGSLGDAIIKLARRMRHTGMRLIVSSQSPEQIPRELVSLSSFVLMHHFTAPKWFDILKDSITLQQEHFKEIECAESGSPLVFCAKAEIGQISRCFSLRVRRRLTCDLGKTIHNTT